MRMSMVTERSAGETTLPKPAIPLGYAGPHNGSKFELTSWSRGTSVAIRTASQCPSQQDGETVMQDGEYTTSQERRTGFIYGYTFIEKPVIYAVIDGQAVFEGDIVLGSAEQLGTADTPVPAPERARAVVVEGVGITGVGFRWPGGLIPFQIDRNLPNQQRVTDAIAHWERNTFIRFVQRTNEPNFVTFRSGGGCSSQVGMSGGEQFVALGAGCSTGNAIHEIGHFIGLWHEQSREDRNNFVTIDFTNIDPAFAHNFNQQITDGDDNGPYDYGSIMHYGAFAFALDPAQPTIIAPQPIGQRNALSLGDILAVATMYGVATPSGYILGNTQHVVSWARDGHVIEFWWDGAWHRNDLTNAGAGPVSVSRPHGYTLGNTQHVVYTGEDRRIHELWWDGAWHHNDLTNATGSPMAVGNPAGYVLGDNTQHVVYRGRDNHIHELWWDGAWHHNDLTNAAGAPNAIENPAAYILNNTQHVVYRWVDDHIHELWWDGAWHHNDLTNAAGGAPPAASNADGYILGNTQHVVYRGGNGHVHELWWDGAWHHNDLTNAAGAPIATSSPEGYTLGENTQHVVYRGGDDHIHELWWEPGAWHHNDLSVAAP